MDYLNKFYTKEDVTEFLDKFKFIYTIPDLKPGYYYQVLLTEDKKDILVAKQKSDIDVISFFDGYRFYDKNRLTFVEFGIKKQRFKIDKEREKRFYG